MIESSSMIRRALGLVVVGVAIGLAGCAARRPARAAVDVCVDRADARRRDCFQDCEEAFERTFVGCYGGRNPCTERCEGGQLACQAGPLHDLAFCGEATENPRSCQARLRADQQACAGRSDRAACEEEARRGAATCWEGCQRAHGPALERCAEAFKACLDGCVAR
jgi:hypothetical protein